MLAYSTISQAGYLLMAVVVAGLLFYLGAYALTNLGAFAVVIAVGRDGLDDYTGLVRKSPMLGLPLVICLLGLVGTPPTAVFVGKLLVFAAALDGGYAWLAVVAAVNTVASVFYYLRWIVPAFGRTPADDQKPALGASTVAYAAAAGSLILGIGSGIVLAVR